MPTTHVTFNPAEVRMRYKEPYLTEGLNAKMAVVQPTGIYRGFRLAGTGTNGELQIVADGDANDHVAVYRTSTGLALTLRRTSSFLVDLSALAGTTVVVAIYATYAVGSTTTAVLRTYTVSEYLAAPELPELVVLGVVTVPSGAPISTFTYQYRTIAALKAAPGAVPVQSLLRNTSFEAGIVNDAGLFAAYFWEKRITGGTGEWRVVTTPAVGSLKSLALRYSVGPLSGAVTQPVNCPVLAGQILRLQWKLRVDDPLVSGSITLAYDFLDASGALTGSVSETLALGSSTSGAFVAYERSRVVPAGVTHLRNVTITATNVTFTLTGTNVVFLDDVTLHLCETDPHFEASGGARMAHIEVASALLLEDPAASPAYGNATLLRHLAAGYAGAPALVGSDRSVAASVLNWLGRMVLGESLHGTAANAVVPRVRIDRNVGNLYTLAFEFGADSTAYHGRVYLDASGATFITHNAYYDTASNLWTRQVAGQSSSCLRISRTTLAWYEHSSVLPATWDNLFGSDPDWKTDFLTTAPGTASSFVEDLAVGRDLAVTRDLAAGRGATLGSSIADDAAGANTVRGTVNACATRARSVLFHHGGNGLAVRLYKGVQGGVTLLEYVVNAVWDDNAATWSLVSSGTAAVKVAFTLTGVQMYTKAASSSAWADNAWGTTAFYAADPYPGTAFVPPANYVSSFQIPKAVGYFRTDGSGGVTLVKGFNIDSSSLLLFGGALLFTYRTAMSDNDYAAHASIETTWVAQWRSAVCSGRTSTGMNVSVFNWSGGAIVQEDLATVARDIAVFVYARQ